MDGKRDYLSLFVWNLGLYKNAKREKTWKWETQVLAAKMNVPNTKLDKFKLDTFIYF